MSNNSIEKIENKSQLIQYFIDGIKKNNNQRIGVEHEKFLFSKNDLKRIDYSQLKQVFEILKDKVARTFAEMENQRRRYEKEKDDAFEYGGFAFARETLNLLDNLERSKTSLEKDSPLSDSKTNLSFPGPGIIKSVALYWSPNACLPITIG